MNQNLNTTKIIYIITSLKQSNLSFQRHTQTQYLKWRWWWWRWLRKGWWWWWITVVNDGYDDERRCWWWDWRFQWWWWRTTVMEVVIEDSGGVERRWWTFGLVFNWSVERFVCLVMLGHCLMGWTYAWCIRNPYAW